MPDYYGDLTGALAYNAARGNAAWSAAGVTDPQREAALLRASEALDGMYGSRFSGQPTGGRAQVRAWPRDGAVDHCTDETLPNDAVPVEIENATYALALAELVTPGSMSPSYIPGAVMKREKAGQVERERFGSSEGGAFGLDAMRPQLAAVEDALRCLLAPKGAGQWMLRV